MEQLDEYERPLFLQHLEAKAKAEADFETLRAIRDYRQMLASPTSTEPPSTG